MKIIAFLIVMFFFLMSLFPVAQAQVPQDLSEDSFIEKQLTSIDTGNKLQRKAAIQELAQRLKQKKGDAGLSLATRGKLVKRLMSAYRQEHGKDVDSEEIRLNVAEIITARGRSSEAKAAIDEIMDSGDERVKNRIMMWLGHSDGVSGDDLVDNIKIWAAKGAIPKRARFSLMGKVSKRRAVLEILKAIDSTSDREEITYAAWALQSIGAHADLAPAFKKVRDAGLHKGGVQNSSPLYWVDKKKFAEYVREAQGEDLKVALELMENSQTMKPIEVIPTLIEKISDGDVEIRKLAISRLEEVGGNYRMDYDVAFRALETRLKIEADATAKLKLAHCLRTLKRDHVHAKTFLQKEQDWIKKNSK